LTPLDILRECFPLAFPPQFLPKLSLSSSPPYDHPSDEFDDTGRRLMRNIRKKLGLPASADVGTIAQVMRNLKSTMEPKLGFQVVDAAISVPHLAALYQDDVEDACEYIGIDYVKIPNFFRPLLWETAVAYAGYGFGLCANYTDTEACLAEEPDMAEHNVFAIHYSRNALTTALSPMTTPYGLWEPSYRHTENFTLGHDALLGYADKSDYWREVQRELREVIEGHGFDFDEPDMIIMMGEKANDEAFLAALEDVFPTVYDGRSRLYMNDSLFAAAKGTAELRMRARYYVSPPYNGTIPIPNPGSESTGFGGLRTQLD
jgi:hypothetical protein